MEPGKCLVDPNYIDAKFQNHKSQNLSSCAVVVE